MKIFTRLVVLFIVTVMIMTTALTACTTPTGPNDNETTPGGATDGSTPVDTPDGSDPADTTSPNQSGDTPLIDVPSSVTLIKDGQATFRLIRSDSASEPETAAAVAIRKGILEIFPNAKFEFAGDFSKTGKYDSNAIEILVGKTKHPECIEVLNSIKYGDYTIQVIGNKVVATAWQESAMTLMANKFCDIIKKAASADRQQLTLTDANEIKVSIVPELSLLPVCTIQNPDRIVNAGDSAYQILMNNTTDEVYRSYTATLLQNGFKESSNRTVNENLLGVYTSDKAAVTIYHTPHNKATRIIVEPVENYYVSSTESYQTVTTPMMTMIGRKIGNGGMYLGVTNDYGLMCFLIRLSDGRFIVVDGGISDNAYGSFSQALYAKMMEQAVDKNNITIAAWVITHSHGDHIGGFCSFSAAYSKQVKLQSILYNFPSNADSEASSDDKGSYARFLTHAKSYYKNTPLYKVHTGHVYTIADATIEIFYTHEDYVTMTRSISSNKNWNNSSIIFGFGIAGQKIMFLGDSQETPNDLTANIFGSALKSDFVQIAHHGGLGGTKPIYKAIDPTIALFTTSDGIIPTYMEKFPANYYLIHELNVVEYYNSHNRIHTWELPYTPKSSGFIK